MKTTAMKIEIYVATIKHDKETTKLRVLSLSGRRGAIQQIMTSEHCPESAILKIAKIDSK